MPSFLKDLGRWSQRPIFSGIPDSARCTKNPIRSEGRSASIIRHTLITIISTERDALDYLDLTGGDACQE